jgi:hypothetical protein
LEETAAPAQYKVGGGALPRRSRSLVALKWACVARIPVWHPVWLLEAIRRFDAPHSFVGRLAGVRRSDLPGGGGQRNNGDAPEPTRQAAARQNGKTQQD